MRWPRTIWDPFEAWETMIAFCLVVHIHINLVFYAVGTRCTPFAVKGLVKKVSGRHFLHSLGEYGFVNQPDWTAVLNSWRMFDYLFSLQSTWCMEQDVKLYRNMSDRNCITFSNAHIVTVRTGTAQIQLSFLWSNRRETRHMSIAWSCHSSLILCLPNS